MNYQGHVEGGVIVLDEQVDLPEGTLVRIEAMPAGGTRKLHPDIQRLAGLIPAHVDVDQARLDSVLEKHSCG